MGARTAPSTTAAPSGSASARCPTSAIRPTVTAIDTVARRIGRRHRRCVIGSRSLSPAVNSDTITASSVSSSRRPGVGDWVEAHQPEAERSRADADHQVQHGTRHRQPLQQRAADRDRDEHQSHEDEPARIRQLGGHVRPFPIVPVTGKIVEHRPSRVRPRLSATRVGRTKSATELRTRAA